MLERSLPVLVLVLTTSCGPIPGGSLGGRVSEPPPDWSAAVDGDRTICEVESRLADPHSIQLECFLYEGSLYAQSHRWARASWWPVQSWAAVWTEHPDVRVRIDDAIFELTAVEVTEPQQREPILRYRGYDPVPAGVVLFRFARRP